MSNMDIDQKNNLIRPCVLYESIKKPLIDISLKYKNSYYFYHEKENMYKMHVYNCGDVLINYSKSYKLYKNKSTTIYINGILNPICNKESKVITRMGYYNEDNGVFVECCGNKLSFVIRWSSDDTTHNDVITQVMWSSDIHLILKKLLRLDRIISFQCIISSKDIELGFNMNGIFYKAYTYNLKSSFDDLPITYEIISFDSDGSLIQVGASIQ